MVSQQYPATLLEFSSYSDIIHLFQISKSWKVWDKLIWKADTSFQSDSQTGPISYSQTARGIIISDGVSFPLLSTSLCTLSTVHWPEAIQLIQYWLTMDSSFFTTSAVSLMRQSRELVATPIWTKFFSFWILVADQRWLFSAWIEHHRNVRIDISHNRSWSIDLLGSILIWYEVIPYNDRYN